jgi:hypothetical protein
VLSPEDVLAKRLVRVKMGGSIDAPLSVARAVGL